MPRLNSKQVYVSTEYKVIIYILEAQINLPHRNRDLFPLDGAGLKRLFHNGRRKNDDFHWLVFDVVIKLRFLRQAVRAAAIVKLGLLLFWNKSVHFGNIVKK